MTTDDEMTTIERWRRAIGRGAFRVVVAGLAAGVGLFVLGQWPLSSLILRIVVGLLLVLPVINVLAVLAEEVRRRDWAFTLLALTVLALLAEVVAEQVLKATGGAR
jgi:uncharacterized membrane protein HdeD (DUF308 family)